MSGPKQFIRKNIPALYSGLKYVYRNMLHWWAVAVESWQFAKNHSDAGHPADLPSWQGRVQRLIHGLEVAHLYGSGKHSRGGEVARELWHLARHPPSGGANLPEECEAIRVHALETLQAFFDQSALVPCELGIVGLGSSSSDNPGALRSGLTVDFEPPRLGRGDKNGFLNVISARRSVRSFLSLDAVNEVSVESAIAAACNAPSACNRQPWRVLNLKDPEVRKQVLKIQGNESGWRSKAGLLLLSVDTALYAGAREFHAAYIDGALFAMNLINSLTAYSVSTCPLNMNITAAQRAELNEVTGQPSSYSPIMIIAYGIASVNLQVPRGGKHGIRDIYGTL